MIDKREKDDHRDDRREENRKERKRTEKRTRDEKRNGKESLFLGIAKKKKKRKLNFINLKKILIN